MMRWELAIAACAALAGCFSDRGLAIEVDIGDTGATSVELYIGKTPCNTSGDTASFDCSGIAPPDGRVMLRGDVWLRDDLLPYTATVHGRSATFKLEADAASKLPVLIAVGLAPDLVPRLRAVGTATLLDVEVPIHGARIVTTTLVAAKPVVTRPTDTADLTEDRVLVWTKQSPPSSCVVVEHWEHGQVTRDFVVPVEDPDCDDVKPECNPTAFHGTSPAGGSITPDCFAAAASGACVLGSHGCSDDGGPGTGACAAVRTEVCVPEGFCGCTSLDGPCTRDKIDEAGSTVPHVDCHIPVQVSPLGIELCPSSDRSMIRLDMFFQSDKCIQPLLGSLQLGELTPKHDFGGAMMELGSPTQPCSFPILWKDGPRLSPSAERDHGIIKLQTPDGAPLLLPIVLTFVPALCPADNQFTCNVAGDPRDALWTCAP